MSDIEKKESETKNAAASEKYKSELKKIVWYSREQTFHRTIVVLVSIIVSAAVIAVVDFSFSHLITWLGSLI